MVRSLAAAAIGLAALLWGNPADATALRCDSCTTDADFRLVAEGRNRPGLIHVYNLSANTMQSWNIPSTGGVISRGHTAASSAQPTKVPSPDVAVEELSRAHTLYVIGGNTIRPIFNVPAHHMRIPATVGKTAHDVVFDANLRGQIESLVGRSDFIGSITSMSLLSAMADLMSMGTSVLGLRDQATILIRYVLDDGSYIDIKVDISDTIGNALEDTARTAADQRIPNNLGTVQGEWLALPAEDLGVMVSHFQRLGASVSSTGSGGTIRAIVCVAAKCEVQYVTE